jgi:hypothetical protein
LLAQGFASIAVEVILIRGSFNPGPLRPFRPDRMLRSGSSEAVVDADCGDIIGTMSV